MPNKWGRTFKIIYVTGKLLKNKNEASGWRTNYTEFSSREVCLSLFIFQYNFGNVESDHKQINLLNSQSYLQIFTDYILRLTSASTEMQEQCVIGNDLHPLKTGVSRYILNFLLRFPYWLLYFTSSFNSTVFTCYIESWILVWKYCMIPALFPVHIM